ncbi:hypothetical protein AB0A69_08035 [Streptomyces sp. NPDC045431]|uniref:hypothetical protein n=1 Tax=Streptomyces sp. NPDC045431 TaxID=3155613 RepID=UPI0033C37C82
MADVVLSNALMWAGKKAVVQDPYDWDDDASWVLGNEDRFRGIGKDRTDALIHAARIGNLSVDVTKYLQSDGTLRWSDVLDDVTHGCMSEFIETPYGVLFMDCG